MLASSPYFLFLEQLVAEYTRRRAASLYHAHAVGVRGGLALMSFIVRNSLLVLFACA